MRSVLALPFAILPIAASADAPRVVVDIAPIHSLVAQVMSGVGTPDVLVAGAASPHDFQFSFDQADQVQSADLVIWAGAGLTPWLDDALDTLAPDTNRLTLLDTDGWDKLDLRSADAFGGHDHDHDGHDDHGHDDDDDHGHDDHGHDDHGHAAHEDHDHEDHADHDDHGEKDSRTDPHAWLDPQVAQIWVVHIAETLSELDPENAALYGANAVAAQADLQALEAEIMTQLSGIGDGTLVVPHDAYQYFGARFDRLAVGAIALDDASAPTPDRIASLRDRIASENITCVLSDPQTRGSWSDLIRENTTAGTALADPMGSAFEPGPAHYHATLTALAAAYAACLS